MKLRISSILPLNSVLRSMSNKIHLQAVKPEPKKTKFKVSDEDIVRIRWLREVSGISRKDILKMYPHISNGYLRLILEYRTKSNVGIDSQFKQPHVSEADTNGSRRKMVAL